jgi:class 3 adenylate cyclase
VEPKPPGVEDALRELGVPDETIARATERGDPVGAFFESLPFRGATDRTVSASEVEARGGLPVAQTEQLMRAFGLPALAAGEPAFTEQEALALRALWDQREVFPFALAVRIARLYGRLLARIAQSEIQQWFAVVEPRLRAAMPDERERAIATGRSFEQLLPVAETLLTGVHRRWIEHEAAQAAVRSAEARTEERLKGAVEVSILFCDLKDFTAFADLRGDGPAAALIDDLATVVVRERGPEARLTKLLGDGFMLTYPEPRLAVQAGVRIIDAMRSTEQPCVHACVHHGFAVPLEGDYFGTAVNIAARLLVLAAANELLATAAVVERCPELDWQPAGTQQIRGVSEPVEIHRLAC